jgi:hypothetical protein
MSIGSRDRKYTTEPHGNKGLLRPFGDPPVQNSQVGLPGPIQSGPNRHPFRFRAALGPPGAVLAPQDANIVLPGKPGTGKSWPSLANCGLVRPLQTAEVHRIQALGPGSRMPHIPGPSLAPANGHRDSANGNSVRGGVPGRASALAALRPPACRQAGMSSTWRPYTHHATTAPPDSVHPVSACGIRSSRARRGLRRRCRLQFLVE